MTETLVKRLNTLDSVRTLTHRAAEQIASIGSLQADGLTIDAAGLIGRKRMEVVNSLRRLNQAIEDLDRADNY